MEKRANVVMEGFPSDEILMGWSVPEGELQGFLLAVDEAAKAVGGIPIVEVDIADDRTVTESMARRESMDCGLIEQAERIIREG